MVPTRTYKGFIKIEHHKYNHSPHIHICSKNTTYSSKLLHCFSKEWVKSHMHVVVNVDALHNAFTIWRFHKQTNVFYMIWFGYEAVIPPNNNKTIDQGSGQ